LSEHEEFKSATIFEHRKGISTDGPYILYEKDSLRVIRVTEMPDDFEIQDERIPKIESVKGFTVNAFSYDQPSAISFTVDLMDSLAIPQSIHPKADKIFTVSDIEGNLYAFHKLLRANEVIDANSNWIFGNGHLVLVGDFVDRGLNVTQCLWLIYKLEQQASKNGGGVHFILGNHELLDLNGHNIHVRSKYKNLASKLGLNYTKDFIGINSELGRWLRTKNSIEKIGDLLFIHAGISQELLNLELSLKEINQIVRGSVGHLNDPDSISNIILGKKGPLCDRGMGHNQDSETAKVIDNSKQYFNVSTLIIGHSTVSDICQQYQGSLINVDVHFPHNDNDTNRGKGLLIEFENRFKVDDFGYKEKI
tara:strand:+ start:1356 stop:2447 length:1092 start_codon:yes stop_codon:yes gene_type:complete